MEYTRTNIALNQLIFYKSNHQMEKRENISEDLDFSNAVAHLTSLAHLSIFVTHGHCEYLLHVHFP